MMGDGQKLDSQRRKLLTLLYAHEPRVTLKEASLAIGKNHAYLQQFVHRGSPRRLSEESRRALADFIGVDEDELRPSDLPPPRRSSSRQFDEEFVLLPVLDVAAAAGAGTYVEQEGERFRIAFRRDWLRSVTSAQPDLLEVIEVRGDSMSPTLSHGDHILVDRSQVRARDDGIYVLRMTDELLVKRITIDPVRGQAIISTDNPAHRPLEPVALEDIHIAGRVIWIGRQV